jgi:hypothetical protein
MRNVHKKERNENRMYTNENNDKNNNDYFFSSSSVFLYQRNGNERGRSAPSFTNGL